jgi:hypothetical protein
MSAKKIKVGDIWGNGHWLVEKDEGEDQYTVRGTLLSCGHITLKSGWALRYNKTAACPVCSQEKKERAVIDKKVDGFSIVGTTDKRDKQGHRSVVLVCEACGSTMERSTAQVSQSRQRGHELKCTGCPEANFRAATINPPLASLTPEQAESALCWAKKGARSVLGKDDEDLQDDIASEAITTILIKGADVGADGIDKLVFRVAQTLAKRRWNRESMPQIEPSKGKDGDDWNDVFDNLEIPVVQSKPGSGSESELQSLALANLDQADQDLLASYHTIKSKSKVQKLRWTTLVSQAKAKLNSILVEIGNQTESDGTRGC